MSNVRLETNRERFRKQPMKLLYISHSVYEHDWHSTPHTHQCTEFFYVISGGGQFRVEEKRFAVSANDMVIINPQVEHTETGSGVGKPMEYIVLGMEGVDFQQKGEKDTRFSVFPCGGVGQELLGYLMEIKRELEAEELYASDVAQSLLELFLFRLMRARPITVAEQPTPKSSRECSNVKHYIDAHYDENLCLDDLANIAHLNKYYLVHSFTKEYGISPINYLVRRRIQESRYFLVNTNYTISQISQILGFSSPSYFSQCFRQAEAMSPTAYRKQQLAQDEALTSS